VCTRPCSSWSVFSLPRRDVSVRNKNRVAQVWLDEEHLEIYQRMQPNHDKVFAGDLRERQNLKNKLNCKSFKW
jgi:polypeptide N-acetylgalactosaminyltransferase